jgi:hypothetical protein
MCASSGVWVSSFIHDFSQPAFEAGPPVLLTIYRYASNTKSWQLLSVTTGVSTCKPLKDGGVVFWGQNEIIRFDSTHIQPQYVSTNADWWILHVADDLEGNLWMSTVNGEIYRQTQSTWILVDTFAPRSHPNLFIDNDGNLWVGVEDKYIYKYSAVNSAPFKEKMFESSLGMGQDFFQDNSGAIWVVTSDRLLAQKEGQFQDVVLPPQTTYINFGFYDSEMNTLFVSTVKGIFALDLDKLSK